MLGGVRLTKLMKDGMNKIVCIAKASIHSMHSSLNTVVGFVQKIPSALQSVRALTKQSKEQLLAQSRTLVVSLMKVVSILAILTLGVLGLLAHLIVYLIQSLASRLWKRGQ